MRRLLYWFTQNRRILDIDAFDNIGVTARFPLWLILFLAAFAVVAAICMYRRVSRLDPKRKRLLTVLRSLAYVAMIFIIVGPKLQIQGEGRPAGPLPIVIDRTESMSVRDISETSRLEAALKLGRSLFANAAAGLGLQQAHYLYGDDVLQWDLRNDPAVQSNAPPADASPADDLPAKLQGSQTSVRKMIVDGLKQHGGAYVPGIVIVGDGAHNAAELVESGVAYVKQRKVPVYFIPTGQERPKDIALDHIIGDDIVFVEEKFRFFVSIQQFGYAGRDLAVKASFGTDNVPVPNVRPEADGAMTFPIEHTPTQTGIFDLKAQIPAVGEEVTLENNTVTRRVRVIKDRIRILLVFGTPSWEFRFLNGAFDRDRRVEHRTYLQSVDPRLFKQTQKRFVQNLPSDPNELLRNYDMVLVSRIDMHSLPPAFHRMLADFVIEGGGSLVVISDGDDLPYSLKGTILEPLLPVRIVQAAGSSNLSQEMFKPLSTAYFLRVSEEGQGNPMVSFDVDLKRNQKIWEGFPPMFELCPEAEVKPSGLVLAEAVSQGQDKPQPAIVYHTVGKGMALYMGFDSTWRWRKEVGDRYFRDYWGKVVQFMGLPHLLGESAQSRLYLDHLEANVGDRVAVTAVIRNKDYSPLIAEAVTISIRSETGSPVEMDLPVVKGRPGIFRASHYPDAEGKFVFSLPPRFESEPCHLRVTRVSREFQRSGVDVPLMRHVADETGGRVFLESLSGSADAVLRHPPATGTNSAPATATARTARRDRLAESEKAAAARESELARLRRDIEKNNGNMFADDKFLGALARHVLMTISERRPSATISEEEGLWDSAGLMALCLIILITEYFFRKRWYLD